jgi:hypothetical protein
MSRRRFTLADGATIEIDIDDGVPPDGWSIHEVHRVPVRGCAECERIAAEVVDEFVKKLRDERQRDA